MKINCQVSGITFREVKTKPDGKVELVHDKENKYDPLAVKVLWGGVDVGFLPAKSEAQKMFHKTPTAVGITGFSFSAGVDETTGEREFNKEGNGSLASLTLWLSGKSEKKFFEKDGKKYQRITSFLGAWEFESPEAQARLKDWQRTADSETVFKFSAKLGTIIHELAEDIAGGNKSRISRLIEKERWQPLSHEERLYDDDLMICGAYDMVAAEILSAKELGEEIMIDWKSSSDIREKHKYQIAFYAKNKGCKKAVVVALGSKNKCGFKLYKMEEAEIDRRYEIIKALAKGEKPLPTKVPITPHKDD